MDIGKSLIQMNSFDAISNVLNGVILHPLQCIDIMKMLYSKRAIVSYDTGTGKTLLASAVMQLLWRENTNRKFLIFGIKDQLQQTPKKIESLTGRTVLASAADAKSIQILLEGEKFLNYPVLLLTHDCLRNHLLMKEIWKNKEQFCGVFIDEAHRLNNKAFAKSADMVEGIARNFEYCVALTATPFTTEILQLAKLSSIIGYDRYSDYKKLCRNIEHGRFSVQEDPLFFINRNGRELGRHSEYVGRVLWVPAMQHQRIDTGGNELLGLCKGEGATRQAEALANLCLGYGGKRGLIYINQHSVREWVLPYLEKLGINYRCINGYTPSAEREKIMHEFNEEKSVDVIVTSVTTAIDLDCDYVVFYEFTANVKQMIGRADRGLKGKVIDVWYVLTRGSQEPFYFYEHIVARSELQSTILGKEIKEIQMVAQDVESEVVGF